jgi:hypothetical protein
MLDENISRLADLSPHLLEDLGFTEITPNIASGIRTWQKDELVVTRMPSQDNSRPLICIDRRVRNPSK